MRGTDLVVRVLENPIINRVIFEGNNAVTTERLEEETEAEPRQTFTLSRVEQDVQRILEVYRRAGRFAATVTPQYKVLPQNRVDLIFVIDEGPTTGVRSINFLGNDRFSDEPPAPRDHHAPVALVALLRARRQLQPRPDRIRPHAADRVLHQPGLCGFPRDLVGRRTDARPPRLLRHLHGRRRPALHLRRPQGRNRARETVRRTARR